MRGKFQKRQGTRKAKHVFNYKSQHWKEVSWGRNSKTGVRGSCLCFKYITPGGNDEAIRNAPCCWLSDLSFSLEHIQYPHNTQSQFSYLVHGKNTSKQSIREGNELKDQFVESNHTLHLICQVQKDCCFPLFYSHSCNKRYFF